MKLGNVAVLVMLGLCSGMAQAQQPIGNDLIPSRLTEAPKVTLSLTVEQAQMVVQTIARISCQDVESYIRCGMAAELLREIQKQVREQQK